jgi:glycosyltransferase involved in cell wall biosynthesis
MRLLHVINSMDPVSGGPSQGIRNLDMAMKNLGVVREVVCLDSRDASYLGEDDFAIHAIGPGRGPWYYSIELSNWLTANLTRFDVIIVNGLWTYHSYATWKVMDKLKKYKQGNNLPRVLIMPHGMLDPYFQKAKERWLKAIRNWFYWKVIESKVINDSDGLLFTCETELLLARETFTPYKPKKEYNSGYGIQPPKFYDSRMKTAFKASCPDLKDKNYILFLGRIHQKKGVDLLVKAYIQIHSLSHSLQIIIPDLVIAGPGLDSGFANKILNELTDFPAIKTKIHFPGMVGGDAKWGALYGCEAFILPSHQENFGIAVVEALACSKPVLISNQVNIWREIHKENGGLVEDDTLAGTIKLLLDWINIDEHEKMVINKNAFKTYENCFKTEKILEKYLTAYSGDD